MSIKKRQHCGLILAAGLALVQPVQATFIDFQNLGQGDFGSTTVSVDGLTVTGSANLWGVEFNGFGVVGGTDNWSVDSGEYLDFTADGPNEMSYFKMYVGSHNVDSGDIDGFTVEAFNSLGGSLGSSSLVGMWPYSDLISQLGFASVDRLRITSSLDTYRLLAVDVTFVRSEVPEPATLALLGLGLTGLAVSRRRKALAS